MKKTIAIMATLFVSMTVNAQKLLQGDYPSLSGQTRINLVIDYSQMTIAKKSVADWLAFRQAEQPQYNATDELEKELKVAVQANLVKQVNDKLEKHGAFLVTDGSGNYTLTVYPKEVTRKGSNEDDCAICDKSGKCLVSFRIKGSGGIFGSMANLWGDGFKDSGKQLGMAMKKCFKK